MMRGACKTSSPKTPGRRRGAIARKRSGGSITCPMTGAIRKPKSGTRPCSMSYRVSMPTKTLKAPERGGRKSRSLEAMDETGAIGWRVIARISRNTCSLKNPSGMHTSPSILGIGTRCRDSSSDAHSASPPHPGAPPNGVVAHGLFLTLRGTMIKLVEAARDAGVDKARIARLGDSPEPR